ncbi:anaerobic sulfatase maturase [Clostridia bacterium]|nr:anaerobic sulfatase maturase [Clostridia bacterium]
MTGKPEPFAVMAKPVGPRCNLQCGYCYYSGAGQPSDQMRMPDKLLELYIRGYIEASPGPVVPFTWHGGEPALAGLDFYRLAVELQKRYLPEGWTCWNNIQTNGILLDDEWCAFLAGAHFDVGLSLDGTQGLHDKYRRDFGGGGTYERAARSVRRLQAHGVQPDLLCTVNSDTVKEPLAVYRALAELNTGWIQFIPIVRRAPDGQLTPDSVSGREYGSFLCAVFDEWSLHDIGRLDIQLFAEMALVWSGGDASLCWMAPTCGRVLVVERDGGVYSCDHFVNPEHRIGGIETSNFSELLDGPVQRCFGLDKRDGLPSQCKLCRWLAVCNGGCPKDRFADNGEPGLNILCGGLRQFFAYAEQPLRQIMSLRRRGFAPEAVMAELRGMALARWKGVGRNDPCPCGSGRKAKHCCWDRRPQSLFRIS